MSFPYKHVLFIGATDGIGPALVDRFLASGVKVTAVGREQDRLDALVQQHGPDKVDSIAFDISQIDQILNFGVEHVAHSPDIDGIFINACTKVSIDFETEGDLNQLKMVMPVDFTSMVALTHAFLPFLQGKDGPSAFIYTWSNPSIIPVESSAAYIASKAASSAFVVSLREQLRDSNVKVIELSLPAVQTELHDSMGEEVGRNVDMPLDQFIDEAFAGFQAGLDRIAPSEVFHDKVAKRKIIEQLV